MARLATIIFGRQQRPSIIASPSVLDAGTKSKVLSSNTTGPCCISGRRRRSESFVSTAAPDSFAKDAQNDSASSGTTSTLLDHRESLRWSIAAGTMKGGAHDKSFPLPTLGCHRRLEICSRLWPFSRFAGPGIDSERLRRSSCVLDFSNRSMRTFLFQEGSAPSKKIFWLRPRQGWSLMATAMTLTFWRHMIPGLLESR